MERENSAIIKSADNDVLFSQRLPDRDPGVIHEDIYLSKFSNNDINDTWYAFIVPEIQFDEKCFSGPKLPASFFRILSSRPVIAIRYDNLCLFRGEFKGGLPADAQSLAGSINETGKAAVYGIYFDTDKSEIKPESEPAISEIVKLLKADPNLKLYVVGHTDNVGAFNYNIRLSQARAAAVVNALVSKHGIASARLTPFGSGPTAPVASNKSEEGRAKNRRVELVAQ